MKIGVSSRGGKSKGLMSILDDYSSAKLRSTFEDVGKRGLNKMVEATPKRTGETAAAWKMDVTESDNGLDIVYSNSKTIKDGTPLVILIKQGHGTHNGGYVPPNDFITPVVDSTAKELARKIKRR